MAAKALLYDADSCAYFDCKDRSLPVDSSRDWAFFVWMRPDTTDFKLGASSRLSESDVGGVEFYSDYDSLWFKSRGLSPCNMYSIVPGTWVFCAVRFSKKNGPQIYVGPEGGTLGQADYVYDQGYAWVNVLTFNPEPGAFCEGNLLIDETLSDDQAHALFNGAVVTDLGFSPVVRIAGQETPEKSSGSETVTVRRKGNPPTLVDGPSVLSYSGGSGGSGGSTGGQEVLAGGVCRAHTIVATMSPITHYAESQVSAHTGASVGAAADSGAVAHVSAGVEAELSGSEDAAAGSGLSATTQASVGARLSLSALSSSRSSTDALLPACLWQLPLMRSTSGSRADLRGVGAHWPVLVSRTQVESQISDGLTQSAVYVGGRADIQTSARLLSSAVMQGEGRSRVVSPGWVVGGAVRGSSLRTYLASRLSGWAGADVGAVEVSRAAVESSFQGGAVSLGSLVAESGVYADLRSALQSGADVSVVIAVGGWLVAAPLKQFDLVEVSGIAAMPAVEIGSVRAAPAAEISSLGARPAVGIGEVEALPAVVISSLYARNQEESS